MCLKHGVEKRSGIFPMLVLPWMRICWGSLAMTQKKLPFKSKQAEGHRFEKRRLTYDFKRSGVSMHFHLDQEKIDAIELLKPSTQVVLGLCYLIRQTFYQLLGLPISIGVAPFISLAKALIDMAKPQWVSGH